MDAVDIYGLSEVMAPAWPTSASGNQGTARPSGKTIFWPEIIDPETGEPCRPTARGRAGVHQPDHRGAADHPLPHARPDAPAAGTARTMRRMENHRPQRRR